MPQKQTTRYTVTDSGDLQGRTAGQDLIQWLADVLGLFSGGRVEITVSRPTRTLRQNRKYWAELSDIAEAFRRAGVTQWHIVGPGGEMVRLPVTKDTLHAWFKRKYLTPKEGHDEPSTTRLDQTEMHDYMERIRHDEDVRKLDIAFRDEDRLRPHGGRLDPRPAPRYRAK
jgi:hypothetical protein